MTPVTILMTVAGFVVLFVGGEFLLRGAVGLSRAFGLSPLLIGLTVVAAATSMPELVVTLTAGLEQLPDVGVGNIVGSNIANTLLILGVAAVLHPVQTPPRLVVRDAGAMLLATAAFLGFGLTGALTRWHGAVMLALLLVYLVFSYWSERRRPGPVPGEQEIPAELGISVLHVPRALVAVLFGAGALIVGSHWLIEGGVAIARAAGVSETVIGATLVAVGTSLPELAAAIVSALRRHPDVALGNVLGSNIFNLLMVLGALALIAPVQLAAEVLRFDIWVLGAVTLGVVAVMMSRWRVSRLEGAIFVALYVGYIVAQFTPAPERGL
jgi:cation:H+ antiporter